MPPTLYKRAVKYSLPLRRVIGRAIPDGVSARGRRLLGLRPVRTIDLAPVELIRQASLSELADVNFLETHLLPALGLHGEAPPVFPAFLHPFMGVGLRHWQYPSQLSHYLVYLSNRQVETYLEIGVQYGGTFIITVEYLNRFHPVRNAYAVDTNRVPSVQQYSKLNPAVRVLREDSSSPRFRRFVEQHGPFDLVLIDGDHSLEGCRTDWETVHPHASMIAFHDVVDFPCPGVREVWEDVKTNCARTFEFVEFTQQYDEVVHRLGHSSLGIGVAIRRADVASSQPIAAKSI